ncbi:MAG: transglutaminase domain-containing protein [Myxococcales bacterium]
MRLGEASCNGKSRLFVALVRATGIPARRRQGAV